MQAKPLITLAFVVVLWLSAVSDGNAAIYKYSNKEGVVSFADNLQSIPQEYRASAVLVSGEQETEKNTAQPKPLRAQGEATPAGTASVPAQEPMLPDSIKKSFFNNRVVITIAVAVSALFAFVILGILNADHKKSIKITRVIILWGMSIYLLVAHGGDVVNLFRSVDSSIDSAKRESEEKGKKAAKALKEMNGLMQVEHPVSQDSGGSDPEKKE